MPAYNFQHRFVPKILNGSKPHTIRRRRTHPTKVGDMLQLYVGLRTKLAFKFAEAPCVKIEPVLIYPRQRQLEIMTAYCTYSPLSISALGGLAKRDGFDSIDEFFYFFEYTYRDDMLEDFEIIWWNPDDMMRRILLLAPGEGKSQPMGKKHEDMYSHRLIEVLNKKGAVRDADQN